MTIKDKDESVLPTSVPFNQVENLNPQAAKPVGERPGALEVADAALRKENYVTRFVYGESNPYSNDKPNASFDPLSNISGYEDHAKWFSEANSDKEVEWIKRQVDQDKGYEDTLKRAGGWGTTARILAGAIAPDIAIGGGVISKVVKGGQYLKAAIAGAETGLISGALYGAGQNVGNPSRDKLDVIKDAGMLSVAGALIGPAFHAAGQLISKKTAQTYAPIAEHTPDTATFHAVTDGIKQYTEHARANVPVDMGAQADRLTAEIDSRMAASSDSQAANQLTLQFSPGHTPPKPSVPYVAPNVGDMNLVGAFGTEKIGIGQAGVALANSPFTQAKIAAQKLFRDMRWRKGNLDGTYTTLQSAESEFERLGHGSAGQGLEHQNAMYDEYVKKGWQTPQTLAYVQGKYGTSKMTFDQFDKEIGHAMSNADRHVVSEVEKVAQHGRTLIDSLAGEASRLGLMDTSGTLKGTALSYFGRSFDKETIIAQQHAFRKLLGAEFQKANPLWTAQQIEDAAQNVYEHIINTSNSNLTNIRTVHVDDTGKMIPLGSRTKTGVAMERKLEIDDNVLEPFMDKSYQNFIRRYSNTVGKDIALTKMIGDTTGTGLRDAILAEKNQMATAIETSAMSDAEKAAAWTQLEQDYNKTIYHLNNGVSLLNGTYKIGSNPHSGALVAARAMSSFNYITKMGGAMVSSLTDPVKNILTFGLAPTLKHTLPAIRQAVADIIRLPSIKDPSYDAIVQANKRIGIGIETALHTRNMAINDIIEQSAGRGPISKGLDYLSEKMGKLNLLDHLTDIQKQMTGVLSNDEVIRSVIAETAGTASERELMNLRRFGIDTDMARRIATEFNTGVTQGHNMIHDGLYLTDTKAWADKEAADTLERTLSAITHTVVYNPSAGAKVVAWNMPREVENLMTQFLSFNLGSHIQHMVPMLQKMDMATMNYIVASVIMGSVVYEIKNQIKQVGSDKPLKDRNIKEQVYDAVSESGLAPMPFLLNSVSSGIDRQMDMRKLVSDDDRPTLSASNMNGMALFGPTGQVLGNVHDIGKDLYNDTVDRGTLSKARQLIPFQNLFYIRSLFNLGESQAQELLDVPDKATVTFTRRK